MFFFYFQCYDLCLTFQEELGPNYKYEIVYLYYNSFLFDLDYQKINKFKIQKNQAYMLHQFIQFDKKEKIVSEQQEPFFNYKSSTATFYSHHNMPLRKIIKEKAQTLNQNLKSQNKLKMKEYQESFSKKRKRLFSNPKTVRTNEISQKQSKQNRLTSLKKQMNHVNNYGRDIFKQQIQRNENIGPGQYQTQFPRSKSFGYIRQEQVIDNIPEAIKLKLKKQTLLGPGKYSYQNSINKLSNHKIEAGPRISSSNLIRTIVAKKNSDNIYLNLNLAEKKQRTNFKIGPGAYFKEKNQFVSSKYRKSSAYYISNTERSNIAKLDKIPGPGFYQWSHFFDKKPWNNKDNKKKPAIQFKFIYGHPS